MTDGILDSTPKGATGNPRAASVRLEAKSLSKAKGQRRHDFRIGRQPAYVDGTRTHLNRVLMPLRPLTRIRAENARLRAARGCTRRMKSDAAVVTAGIITFGKEAQKMFKALSVEEQDAAYLELAEAVAQRLNTSLEALVVHADETAPHAHFTLRAYANDGRPLSKCTNRRVTSELQELAAEIMREHCPGIEPGHKKRDRLALGADLADTIHRSVRQLHEDLPAEIAKKEAQLAQLQSEIGELLEFRAETERRFAMLADREQRNAREEKRLEADRDRLARRQIELDQRERELEALQAVLDNGEQALKLQQEEIQVQARKLEQECKAVEQREQEAKAAIKDARAIKKEFEDALKAIVSILRQAVQGALRFVDGRFHLDDPTVVEAVSPRLRKELVPLMNQFARAQAEIDGSKNELWNSLERVREWLSRDDLTDEARRDGEGLLDDGVDGPG